MGHGQSGSFGNQDGKQGTDIPVMIASGALAMITVYALTHPHPIVLPLLSVVLVVGGFAAMGLQALFHRGTADVLGRLKVPGIVVFFGFAAAMLGDPDPAVQSLQQVR